jgi:hypothetical protein
MKEPALMRCAVREGDDEWHIECRFSDGQKYAAIKLDGACPQLATRVAALLNSNIWTDERPSEPGEYWLSIPPKQRTQYAHRCDMLPVRVKRSRNGSLVVGLIGTTGFWEVTDAQLNGAKWSRRETPADPFEVTG